MENIMKYEPVLPEDFDGTFRFSNPSDEDFIGRWNSKEYIFKAGTTSKLIMPDHSPLEIQHIRKKFARDLAEREFFKSQEYQKKYKAQEVNSDGTPRLNSMHMAGQYNDTDLTEYIQKCLTPLETAELLSKAVEKVPLESVLHRDEDGELVTQAIDKNTSLRQKALKG